MTYFQNVQDDAVNTPYFNKLPEHEKKLLGYLRYELAGSFANAWTHMLIRKGFTNKGFHTQLYKQSGNASRRKRKYGRKYSELIQNLCKCI